MSFRKRNSVLRAPRLANSAPEDKAIIAAGVRPSPHDGRLTTSTGTITLDQILAGHAGLPLGSSLLIQESGTTDFAGTLLRYFAAEGLVQGHHVHVLGAGDEWRRDLPGLASHGKPSATQFTSSSPSPSPEKMRIAWRYGALGNVPKPAKGAAVVPVTSDNGKPFCHDFDMAKRLESGDIAGQLLSHPPSSAPSRSAPSALGAFIADTALRLKESSPSSIHRIIVPSILSPTLYSPTACQPTEVIQFFHSLRGLLRQFPTQVTALVTLPVSLYPRSTGLTRWMELLSDGVLELIPFQHHSQMGSGGALEGDKSQGLLRVHCLPVFHEKGGGLEGGSMREDMSFKLSASSGLVIVPFSLPPVGGDDGANNSSKPSEDAPPAHLLDF
ncbi:Elongator complex protein 4 [Drechmeria coniospora]|uniref:Elongator complex protein 4 n=1 Tax=Drechmeria coniospora TaxID=98403 RepID=A0A151GFM2_DRECN|nr:Elongator complex protein 4 [Drechmeria coniospora]KYK55866.1 Elongator complex protein 4 [Drechmeria coniospora]ODA81544.1 hypothetical protein RJ55_00044 [Drechmeria coniospora]